jgi:hypothetical protein
MNTENWLTLSEVIRKGDLDDNEARRLVKKLGDLLSPRNFGDVVKYPAPVAELLARLIGLRREGWTNADLKNLLIITRQEIREDGQARRFNLLEELRQESASLLKSMDIVINFAGQMQEALRSVAHLLTSFDSLIVNMLDQEKESRELRAKEESNNSLVSQ